MITVRKLTPIGCFLIRHHLAVLNLIAKINKVFKGDKLVFYIIKFNCIDLQIILDANTCDADHPDFKDLVMNLAHDYIARVYGLRIDSDMSGVMQP